MGILRPISDTVSTATVSSFDNNFYFHFSKIFNPLTNHSNLICKVMETDGMGLIFKQLNGWFLEGIGLNS